MCVRRSSRSSVIALAASPRRGTRTAGPPGCAWDHAPRLDEPLVHAVHAAVGVFALLVEERGKVLFPPAVGDEPRRGGVPVLDACQGGGNRAQPSAGLQAGPPAGQFEDVGLHVVCTASIFVGRVRQCFSAVWADGFPGGVIVSR